MYQRVKDVLMLPGAVNIFVLPLSRSKALIIDTGSDKESGRKIFKTLSSLGFSEASILNTHHHTDHIGGNSYLQGKLEAQIYADAKEACFIEHPYLESFAIYGLAEPLTELKGKGLLAKPSLVNNKISLRGGEELNLDFSGVELRVVSIPGHSIGQLGVITPKGLFITADAFFSEAVLSKYGVPFHSDTEKYLDSLKGILGCLNGGKVEAVAPSHGSPLEIGEAETLIKLNISKVFEIENLIVSAVRKGVNRMDSLASYLLNCYSVERRSILQFYLTIVPVRAMISYMERKGRVKCEVKDEGLTLKAL